MKLRLKIILVSVVMFVSGCSEKQNEVLVKNTNQAIKIESQTNSNMDNIDKIFEVKAKEQNVNVKTLKAICKHESENNPYAVNVNKKKNQNNGGKEQNPG